jgi:hypothetical protein
MIRFRLSYGGQANDQKEEPASLAGFGKNQAHVTI